jgi:hypothetical protein
LSPTPLPPDPHRSREELLGIVRTRAGVLRRRRRAAISGTLALTLAVLGGGAAISRNLDSGPSVQVHADQGKVSPAPESSTTTATSAPDTTTSSAPARHVPTTTTTRAKRGPTTSTTAAPPVVTTTTPPSEDPTTTTTAPPVCRNSTDPRCGPFRWDPEATKGPMPVQVSVLTAEPVAGKPVTFKVVVDNADRLIEGSCYERSDSYLGGTHCAHSMPFCEAPTPYGPWAPPERRADHFEMTPSFTYDKPGTYTLSYTFRTRWPGCHPWSSRDPYANSGTGSVTFTVRPPAEGEGSTTTTSSSTTTTTRRKPG